MFAPIFTNVLMIIAGIVGILFACSWPKGTSRLMFVLFIAGYFLIHPIVSLASLSLNVSYSFQNNSIQWWYWCLYYIQITVSILSLIPFLIFVASAKQMSNAQTAERFESNDSHSNAGPAWDTNLSKTQIKQISTKRNLAYVVDSLPLMTLTVGSFYLLWMIESRVVSQGAGILIPIGTLFACVYLLFKDSFNGQSIGKLLLGCRVVSARSGQPIGPGESFLRNILFMVPLMPLVELIVSKSRDDGKRLGDLCAKTLVVAGPPQWIDGIIIAEAAPKKKHPLDD